MTEKSLFVTKVHSERKQTGVLLLRKTQLVFAKVCTSYVYTSKYNTHWNIRMHGTIVVFGSKFRIDNVSCSLFLPEKERFHTYPGVKLLSF